MVFKKYVLTFIYLFFISVLVYMSVDLKADYKRMIGLCLIISVMSTLLLLNLEKPLKKLYRENFDRKYKYNKMRPITKDKKENKKDSTPVN